MEQTIYLLKQSLMNKTAHGMLEWFDKQLIIVCNNPLKYYVYNSTIVARLRCQLVHPTHNRHCVHIVRHVY